MGWNKIEAAVTVFDGPEWRIKVKNTTDYGRRADIVVSVVGLQYGQEHAEFEIIIDCPDTPVITPEQARSLGTALIAAAEASSHRALR